MARPLFRAAAVAALLLAARGFAAQITEYPLAPSSGPLGITLGPDGKMWFTESTTNRIASIANDGTIHEIPLQNADSFPSYIQSGPFGWVYFNEPGSGHVGFYDALGNYGLHEDGVTGAVASTLGFGGYLWQVHADSTVTAIWPAVENSVARTCTFSDGLPHDFTGIASLFDGTLVITDTAYNGLVTLSVADGACTFGYRSFPFVPAQVAPQSITLGSDSLGWFVEVLGDKIGIDYGGQSPVEVALAAGSLPRSIVPAPDGTYWFTESGTNKIGHITHDRTITEYTVPTPNSKPWGIAVGADGSVWFTEYTTSKIGRLQLHPAGDVNGDGSVNVSDVFYLINFLFAGGPTPKS